MPSSLALQTLQEDDEEFDWEAAVREIDVACEATNPIASNPTERTHEISASLPTCTVTACTKDDTHPLITHEKPSTRRESTLRSYFRTPVWTENHDAKPFKKSPPLEQNVKADSFCVKDEDPVSCVSINAQAAETWIYPVNMDTPLRDYQLSITRTALFSNTLVVLPTGLGKTFIAAVVMYNYFRWFPEGKIIFAAPSRPLVMQQIEACHYIVGIPQEWTIDLTGQVSPAKRIHFWKTKRVFFVTPQVLEKDIQSGSCPVKCIVCLVIDEAHRALGNYSYCVAVRELFATPIQLRILALTATPGSNKQTIQHIIDNLQISTLEYRNESDYDVIPYIHDRKIDLIEVAMGKDAIEINDLLLEAVLPFVRRLANLKVIQCRGIQLLSPCELLNSRDKFRQAPPQELPHINHGEVEGSFAVLITLYYIRKLLLSHGVSQASDMVEEKLQKGSFAGMMSRNEAFMKARELMKQSMSHGASSPKLSKMIEVLIDHFNTNDPQNSRVIIFSNFRGSVRDILNALTAQVGEFVRATEFIGQSSGKALKGQSQKVQQAILEKFRSGGFNVIVATSIGEEGLDIMEVDLVICFDANISPLRMIQRMGRTGRKHEGRVVVLAYEGLELKGYHRKQSNSKAIKKHMRNGGMYSFIFHSSPRMIPHLYKPEPHFIELSIEQFVPRGRTVKDDKEAQAPLFDTKLNNSEIDLIVKYFNPTGENIRYPSLISFPHYQAFPSRVHKVVHSFRTEMLISTVQQLHGPASFKSKKTSLEGKIFSDLCTKAESIQQDKNHLEDLEELQISPANYLTKVLKSDILVKILNTEQNIQAFQETSLHPNSPLDKALPHESNELALEMEGILADQSGNRGNENLITSGLHDFKAMQKQILAHIPGQDLSNKVDGVPEIHDTKEENYQESDDEMVYDTEDTVLSPRLANFLENGIVPESPVDDIEWSATVDRRDGSSGRDAPELSNNEAIHTLFDVSSPLKECTSGLPVDQDIRSPLADLSNNTSSKDWYLSSADKTKSIEQKRKFRRLRKYGDICKRLSETREEHMTSSRASHIPFCKGHRVQNSLTNEVKAFIEEEAEVSSEGLVPDDDDDECDKGLYDDSFIDDKIDPTAASPWDEGSRIDMMAIYRRSLLTQSPMEVLPAISNVSPDSVVPKNQISQSGSGSTILGFSLQSQTGMESARRSPVLLKPGSTLTEAVHCSKNDDQGEHENKGLTSKRKLNFPQTFSVSLPKSEPELLVHTQASHKDSQQGLIWMQ